MPASLTFSIILCSRNRSQLLAEALPSMLALDYPKDAFELILVDNASTDDTRDVMERFAREASFSVRIVVETRLGLSAARNRGIRESRGRLLFFTDDDQLVDPAVLREHERVADTFGSRVQQGNIELLFPEGQPRWLRGELATVLGKTRDVPEGPADIDLYGGNLMFRRDVFDELAAFREDLGKGQAGYSEDIEITRRLKERGERIVYAPTARIYHVIHPDRATPGFFRRNSLEKGLSDGLILDPRTSLVWLGVRTTWKLYGEALAAAYGLSMGNSHRVVRSQSRAANHLGRLAGFAKQRMGRLVEPSLAKAERKS
jgi:glycosyltransferase involved in cell wall biosynthesis